MADRHRSPGKQLRFELFKRDHFTCQYCGAQPPGVVLVIDHIVPFADGGETAIENLITACEPCNQGKGARSLGARVIHPDADLLYLEMEQEAAELRRFYAAKNERDRALNDLVVAFQDDWELLALTDWFPSDSILRSLLARYGPEITELAVHATAAKVASGYVSEKGIGWRRYLYGVARQQAMTDESVGA